MPFKVFSQQNEDLKGNSKSKHAITKTVNDTTVNNDSIKNKDKRLIDTKVDYNAEDSIVLSADSKKVFLYKKAKVVYGDITLEADYIEYDQEKNFVFAHGVEDSLGNLIGKPVFSEKNDKFNAKTIKYNFKTKKGYIEDVFTEEEQGFLHSEQTKKLADNSFLLKNGKYTTCDKEEHPHYYLAMTEAKVIPNDKIISGPAYLVIQDIPIKFVGVPFGFFPNQNEYSSGLIIPKYGEETKRGFYLQDGGYYFGISDKMDLAVTGDIFSKGSWGSDIQYRYKKRYKFNSTFNFSYAEFVQSEEGLPDFRKDKSMSIRWNHSRDPKANPNSKFSASVNYSTKSYDQFNSKTPEQRATNTKSSSISYGKTWPDSPFRFNMDLRHSQNSNTNDVNLTLPALTFNMNTQYPFRRKNPTGEMKWYENIEIQYSSKLENRLSTPDTLLFHGTKFSDFENGFQNSVPLSTNFKILKYFNLSPKIEYTGILYPNYINRYYDANYYNESKDTYGALITDTINQIRYAQLVEPSVSFGTAPNIYGTFQSTNQDAKIIALRHVLTPSASISFRPDMGNMVNQYYDNYDIYQSGKSKNVEYSIFENGLYPFPAAPGKSASVNFGLNNNLEMKVRDYDDTTGTGTKKIKLLESLRFSTSYNIFADSLNWSQLSISGRTSIFNNKVGINFGATVDPYALSNDGRNVINEFQFINHKGIGRLESVKFSINFKLNSTKEDDNSNKNPDITPSRMELDGLRKGKVYQPNDQIVTYVDFDVPWDLSADYIFNYTKTGFDDTKKITQTLKVSGNISLTKNWKISFSTNYDLVKNELSYTTININRDLHCWEMTFSWIPVGTMQSYNFQINVKGSTLRDLLKYNKRKSWQDNL